MSMVYRIEYNDGPVQAALDRLIALGQSPREVMRDIAAYGESSTKARFADGVGPDGTPWKPSWRVQTRGGKTLIDHGHLMNISADSGDDFAEWGSNAIYAVIQQLGGVIKPKNKPYLTFKLPGGGFRRTKQVTIPARPYLGINEDDEENIIDIVNSHLADAVNI